MRWIIFDNQKVNGFLGPFRFLKNFARPAGDPAVMAFLKGRIDGSLAILDKRLAKAPFVLGDKPTIADISFCAYLYYPADEFGFDIAAEHKSIGAWLGRMKALPNWATPLRSDAGLSAEPVNRVTAEYRAPLAAPSQPARPAPRLRLPALK